MKIRKRNKIRARRWRLSCWYRSFRNFYYPVQACLKDDIYYKALKTGGCIKVCPAVLMNFKV
jgi:hypothetical protein